MGEYCVDEAANIGAKDFPRDYLFVVDHGGIVCADEDCEEESRRSARSFSAVDYARKVSLYGGGCVSVSFSYLCP
jgi:hypothetical protein